MIKWFKRRPKADTSDITQTEWDDLKNIYKTDGWNVLEKYLAIRRRNFESDIVSMWASTNLDEDSQKTATAKTIGIVSRIMETTDFLEDIDDEFNEPIQEKVVERIKTIRDYL